jgi:hypothetical protein
MKCERGSAEKINFHGNAINVPLKCQFPTALRFMHKKGQHEVIAISDEYKKIVTT